MVRCSSPSFLIISYFKEANAALHCIGTDGIKFPAADSRIIADAQLHRYADQLLGRAFVENID